MFRIFRTANVVGIRQYSKKLPWATCDPATLNGKNPVQLMNLVARLTVRALRKAHLSATDQWQMVKHGKDFRSG
jgi:hypothetical protein